MSVTFTGTYSSSFGTLKFKQVGLSVIGDYRNIGIFQGTYNQHTKTLTGFFINDNKKGRFSFTLTTNGFDGLWAWGDAEPNQAWNGKRLSSNTPELENAYFEGVYDTTHGEIRLQQHGKKIVGDYGKLGIIEGHFDEKIKRVVATFTNKGKKGNLVFDLSDEGFKGKWAWGNATPTGRWNGTKRSWKQPTLSMHSTAPSTPQIEPPIPLSVTQQRLNHLKVALKQNGLSELSVLGKLSIKARNQREGLIVTSGFLTPPRTPNLPFSSLVNLQGIKTLKSFSALSNTTPTNLPTKRTTFKASRLKMKPLTRSTKLFRHQVHIAHAYWVADEIIIHDNTKVVFTNACKHLFLIANKVTIGRNVQFSWEEPAYNNAISAHSTPRQPRQTRRPNRSNHVIHGRERIHGQDGKDGVDGVAAPHLQIWTLDLTGTPIILFKGQNGQDAQNGQNGSKGQNGANGIKAKANTIAGVFSGCAHYAGSGGNGASGGNGGDGGNGGKGGQGGKVEFFIPATIKNRMSNDGFVVDISGGEGGDKGRGGRGGAGGEGGTIGRSVKVNMPSFLGGDRITECGSIDNARNGRDGNRGSSGHAGHDGDKGGFYDHAIKLKTIEKADFNKQLNAPAIIEIKEANRSNRMVEVAHVGDKLFIEGLHFSATDTIKFNGVEAVVSGIQSDTFLICTIPDIEGGDTEVWIEQEDGTKSNPYTLVIRPQITSIQQQNEAGRLQAGKQIIIKGNGLSDDTEIFAENVKLSAFTFINKHEVRALLIRPFPAHVPANNLSGEDVRIKARIPATREGTIHSNRFNVVMDTLHMLVIGDSIQWGQGLQEHEKIHSLVESEIKTKLSNKIAVHKTMLAHSGATIGAKQPDKHPKKQKFHGEINVSSPTVREQVNIALAGKDTDDSVDLVLLDGGINDLGIKHIIDPNNKKLTAQIKAHCYDRMKTLLEEVSTKFPNAKIIVTGYYQIISERSDTDFIDIGLAALGLAVANIAGAVAGITLSKTIIEKIQQNCLQFKQDGHKHIKDAIADVMAQTAGASGRIFFADPDFTVDNAIFASNPFIFGVGFQPNPDLDLEPEIENILTPEDNPIIAQARIMACNNQLPEDAVCPIASCGHPTPQGAAHYASSVITQLRVAMPKLYNK